MKELSLTVTNGDMLEQLCRKTDGTYWLHRWTFHNTFDMKDLGTSAVTPDEAMQWLRDNHMDDTFSTMLAEADSAE